MCCSFLTALLRAANPKDGGVFYDLGSGWGKAVFGTAALYPRLKKVVGIEYLPGLNSKATALQSKFSRIGGAPISFVNKDFTSVSVADADVIFAYATFYLTTVRRNVRPLGILDRFESECGMYACIGLSRPLCYTRAYTALLPVCGPTSQPACS